jgi:hypothetical protein
MGGALEQFLQGSKKIRGEKSEKCNNKKNGIKIKLLECILILKNKLSTLLDCFPDMCKQAIYKI